MMFSNGKEGIFLPNIYIQEYKKQYFMVYHVTMSQQSTLTLTSITFNTKHKHIHIKYIVYEKKYLVKLGVTKCIND